MASETTPQPCSKYRQKRTICATLHQYLQHVLRLRSGIHEVYVTVLSSHGSRYVFYCGGGGVELL